MMRLFAVLGVALVAVWVFAHLLYLDPVPAVAETLLVWLAGIATGSAVIAGLTVLSWGVIAGRTTPLWLRFVAVTRAVAAVIGCGLVVVGLLHYRETEPRSEIMWLAIGVALLAAAVAVHGWLVTAMRRQSS